MPGANDDLKHLTQAEQEVIHKLHDQGHELKVAVEKLVDNRTASLDLAAELEDAGNQLIELSEHISATYTRRSRLRAVE